MDRQERINADFQKFFSLPEIQHLLPRSPNMRYWQRGKAIFAWTTEPVKGKFWALRYRVLKNKSWRLKHKVAFGRRKIAKARAKKWFEEA